MRQLALPFLHRETFAPDGFILSPTNEDAFAVLRPEHEAAWPDRRLALWGGPGTGKTHLLHIWLGRVRAAGRDAALLDGAAVRHLAPDAPLPAAGGGLALDDADAAFHEPEALLHLLNRLAEAGTALLFACRGAPARAAIPLPDLASRLRATLAIAILPPDDALLDALFLRLLAERQIAIPPAVVRFLRDRLPRDPAALRDATGRLDAASLERGAPITTGLAATLLPDPDPVAPATLL